MKKYLVQGRKTKVQMIFSYNAEGILVGYEVKGELSPQQFQWLINHFPFTLEWLDNLRKEKYLKVEEIVEDASFDAFWGKYSYKVGNKARAEKLWNKVPEMDRIIAMSRIEIYDSYLKLHPNIEKAYPETWINQRRWENEYKQ